MTPVSTTTFIMVFKNCCTIMGWNQGARGIAKLQNSVSIDTDIVKCYGQIDKATLKMHCDVFCKAGGAKLSGASCTK